MSAKHTPGPWALSTVRTQVGWCHKVGPFPSRRGESHACVYEDGISNSPPVDSELLANARLIAAAPELLEVLRALVEQVANVKVVHIPGADPKRFHDAFTEARAAIAKAEGK